jgi:hypothetical protein
MKRKYCVSCGPVFEVLRIANSQRFHATRNLSQGERVADKDLRSPPHAGIILMRTILLNDGL